MIKVGKSWRDTGANANGQSTDTQRTRYELEASDVGRTLPNYKGHEYSSYTIKRGDVGKVVEYIHETRGGNYECWYFID